MQRVLVVGDSAESRALVRPAREGAEGQCCAGEASDGAEAGPERMQQVRPRLAVLGAGSLFLAVFVLRLRSGAVDAGLGILYVVPIAFLAIRFGLRAGLGGAVLAGALFLSFAVPHDVTPVAVATRLVAFLLVAVTVGWYSDNARRQAGARARDGAALVAANRRLAEAVRLKDQAYADLEAVNEGLRQFGYVVSHDLSEPLRTMAGFAELLERRCGSALDDRGREYVGHIMAGAERMQSLIGDLNAYARAGQQEVRRDPVDVGELLADVTTSLGAGLRERGAVVRTRGPLPTVVGDRGLLALVLQNLVSNAVKFNTSAEPTVTVSGRVNGAVALVDVTDNGIGIPPGMHSQIFELFGRLHTREEYPGTGLGLATCHRIVARHGGRLCVDSEPGRGTTFTVELTASE